MCWAEFKYERLFVLNVGDLIMLKNHAIMRKMPILIVFLGLDTRFHWKI